jgi:hypothetical protein
VAQLFHNDDGNFKTLFFYLFILNLMQVTIVGVCVFGSNSWSPKSWSREDKRRAQTAKH